MICAFLFNHKDVAALQDLLKWCAELGGCKQHDALLVADLTTPAKQCMLAHKLAKSAFKEVRSISNGKAAVGWPQVPNSLFWAAANYINGGWPQPWLVMQSDAIPLKAGWLDLISQEYSRNKAPFMGDVYSGVNSGTGQPTRMLSGISVYPPDAVKRMQMVEGEPWDMTNRELMLSQGRSTLLIKNFYGTLDTAPTFVNDAGSGIKNAFTLGQIPEEAVLWHRNKDGTLINLLRRKLGIQTANMCNPPNTLPIVVYVYPGDVIPESYGYALRFVRSYRSNPPGMPHETVVVLNHTKLTPLLRFMFGFLQGVRFLEHDDSGWDIGAYQHAARENANSDLMVFFGTSAYLTHPGWLVTMVNAHTKYGPGIYGCMGNRGNVPIGVYPHIRTTGFWIQPRLFNAYPVTVTTPEQRYPFEHGANCLTAWITRQRLPAMVVTTNGEYAWKDWDLIPEGYRRGSESALLCKDRINDIPFRQPPPLPNESKNRNLVSRPFPPSRQLASARV